MNKKLLFLIPMIIIAVFLFLFRATGMTVHIVASVAGLLVLVAYTLATKKEWRKPALEIAMRVFYAVALITGVVIMNVEGIKTIAIIHKISAVLFVVFLLDTEIHKAIKSK